MTDYFTYAFVAAVAGSIGGITGWIVNVLNLRKARLELQLLQEQVKKLNTYIRTDLSMAEIERYGRQFEYLMGPPTKPAWKRMKVETCPVCNGNGIVGDMSLKKQCHRCFGKGYIEVPDKPKKKVVCTELFRQRRMNAALYRSCERYADTRWTQETFNGYHFWAVPLVKAMRRSKSLSWTVSFFAIRRARHVACHLGNAAQGSFTGCVVALLVDGGSALLGSFCSGRDYLQLYKSDAKTTAA